MNEGRLTTEATFTRFLITSNRTYYRNYNFRTTDRLHRFFYFTNNSSSNVSPIRDQRGSRAKSNTEP